MASLCSALEKNKSIKTLNLYRNIIDIDGARALKKVLEKNSSLEFLDLSFNRLREKGIKALTDGMVANASSHIKELALRSNFINDDGFAYFFEKILLEKK